MSPSHAPGRRAVLALVPDLMFASKIRGTAAQCDVPAVTVRTADEILDEARTLEPRLILLDLEARKVDVPALILRLKSESETAAIPVVGFGSHVNREAFETAGAAGADQVLARSAFVRRLPDLLRGTDVADSRG